jgi:hypothetical protein
MMTSMRGGFRSAVKGVTGDKPGASGSPGRRFLTNLITIALLITAAVLLLRRFGVL